MSETIRDDTYLDYIRDKPCIVCGDPPPSDPHHLDSGVMGSKGDDWTCVPMCRRHHQQYHEFGERTIEEEYKVNLWKEAHRLLSRYHHRRLTQ